MLQKVCIPIGATTGGLWGFGSRGGVAGKGSSWDEGVVISCPIVLARCAGRWEFPAWSNEFWARVESFNSSVTLTLSSLGLGWFGVSSRVSEGCMKSVQRGQEKEDTARTRRRVVARFQRWDINISGSTEPRGVRQFTELAVRSLGLTPAVLKLHARETCRHGWEIVRPHVLRLRARKQRKWLFLLLSIWTIPGPVFP